MDLAAREALDMAHDDIGDRDRRGTPGHWVADAVPHEIARLRAALGAFARSLGAPDALVDDVRLAVTEALANAVMHAYHDGALGRVDARASADPAAGLMTVRVRDYGMGYRRRADSPGMGQGHAIMAALARTIDVASPPTAAPKCVSRIAVPAAPQPQPLSP
jgi:anti-sigma regulatory factor (Ser/Thr protein kinase)